MAVKGQKAKEEIKEKLFEIFKDNIFINGKEIRISCIEDNEPVEIKITLTAAKNLIKDVEAINESVSTNNVYTQPTQEELDRINKLFENLK